MPAAAGEQVRQRGADGVERAEPVDPRHRARRGSSGLVAERAVVRDAGVGDDQVEAAGRVDEAVDGGAGPTRASPTSQASDVVRSGQRAASASSSSVERAASADGRRRAPPAPRPAPRRSRARRR